MRRFASIILLLAAAMAASTCEARRGRRSATGLPHWQRSGSFEFSNTDLVVLGGTGTDRIEVEDHADFDASTINWVSLDWHPDSDSSNGVIASRADFSCGVTGCRAWILDVANNNNLRLISCSGGGCSTYCDSEAIAWVPGRHYQISAHLDLGASSNDDRCRIRLNGADVTRRQVGTHATSFDADVSADFAVGARMDGNGTRELDGEFDNVRFGAGSLPSQAQWEQLADCSFGREACPGDLPGEVLRWDVEGDTGSTVTDRTGNGHDGTIYDNGSIAPNSVFLEDPLEPASCSFAYSSRLNFVGMGQSNESGRGLLAAKTAFSHDTPWVLRNSHDWEQLGVGTSVDDNTGQVDSVSSDGSAGAGHLHRFADLLRPDLSHEYHVAVTNCALGGSEAVEWAPGGTSADLLGSCLRRVTSGARNAISAPMDDSGSLAGVIIYQGESDTGSADEPELWARRWQVALERIRNDAGQPCLPALIVQLPESVPAANDADNWAEIRSQQSALAALSQDNLLVPAPDGPYEAGDLHLDTSAQEVLAGDLSDAWQTTRMAAALPTRPTSRYAVDGVEGQGAGNTRLDGSTGWPEGMTEFTLLYTWEASDWYDAAPDTGCFMAGHWGYDAPDDSWIFAQYNDSTDGNVTRFYLDDTGSVSWSHWIDAPVGTTVRDCVVYDGGQAAADRVRLYRREGFEAASTLESGSINGTHPSSMDSSSNPLWLLSGDNANANACDASAFGVHVVQDAAFSQAECDAFWDAGGWAVDPSSHSRSADFNYCWNIDEGAGGTTADACGSETLTLENSIGWVEDSP